MLCRCFQCGIATAVMKVAKPDTSNTVARIIHGIQGVHSSEIRMGVNSEVRQPNLLLAILFKYFESIAIVL